MVTGDSLEKIKRKILSISFLMKGNLIALNISVMNSSTLPTTIRHFMGERLEGDIGALGMGNGTIRGTIDKGAL